MSTINEEYFYRSETPLEAAGYQFSQPRHEKNGDAYSLGGDTNGGLRNPVELTVLPGTTLVRFGNAHRLVDGTVYGQWWIDFPAYRQIEAFADTRRITIAHALSLVCAVPAEWNSMTLVVQAVVRYPLLAYSGVGNPARSHSGVTIDPASTGVAVDQLFIPGLASPDLARKALKVKGYGLLPGDPVRR